MAESLRGGFLLAFQVLVSGATISAALRIRSGARLQTLVRVWFALQP